MGLWLSRPSLWRGKRRGLLLWRSLLRPGDVFFRTLRSGVPVLRGRIKAWTRLVCGGENRLSVRRTLICRLARSNFPFPCRGWGHLRALRFGRALLRSCALIDGALLCDTGLGLALLIGRPLFLSNSLLRCEFLFASGFRGPTICGLALGLRHLTIHGLALRLSSLTLRRLTFSSLLFCSGVFGRCALLCSAGLSLALRGFALGGFA